MNEDSDMLYTHFTEELLGLQRVKITNVEKGTVECHNRMFRCFIPKGKSIDDYTADDICFFADSINGLPRKILSCKTPEELFKQELDLIYAA